MSSASSLTEAVKQIAAQTTSLTDAVKEAARSGSEATVIEFPRAAVDCPRRGPIVRLVATAPHIDAPPRAPSDEPPPDAAPDVQRPSRPPAGAGRPLARTVRRPRLPSLLRDALRLCRTAIHNLIRAVTRAGLKVAAVLLLCFLSMAVTPSRVASDRPPGAALEHSALTGRSHFNPSADAPAAVKPASDVRAREAAEAWSAAKATRSLRVLEAFIARYGDTFYAELARARMAELRKLSRSFGK
ncbi:MAG: hypothetical protein WAN86_14780 [Hyphomicrobiaceae bacterium]